ncbi:MAG TPA: SDR family oxidoreductase [Blastocatellia bacterium]|nr:SDR family oxidoreductase [Blastocatellia bacterium]
MDLGLRGKVAIVAGSSSGLGLACATELAREGASVVINGRRQSELSAAADAIRSATGATIHQVIGDVSKETDVRTLVESTLEKFGRLDIAVPNAGGPPVGYFDDFADSDYRRAIELNLISTVNLCRAAVPEMRKNRWGRIAAITSISAKQPVDNLILSNTSRAATVGFLRSLAQQVASEGITVNVLCPGLHLTQRLRAIAALEAKQRNVSVEEVYSRMASTIPMSRLGQPEEFAGLVAFLCSERASYITGTVTQIDGGLYKGLI